MGETLAGIPHLKLPPAKLLNVLDAVKRAGPERPLVVADIRGLFPGMSEKSVIRGMALPAGTRLQLVRATDDTIVLAPNGGGAFLSRLSGADFVAFAIRATAITRYGIRPALLADPGGMEFEISGMGKRSREPIARFVSYLRFFQERRLAWSAAGFRVLPGPNYRTKLDLREGRSLIDEELPKGRLLSLDEARSALLRRLWKDGVLATSFDVDDLFAQLYSGDRPPIQLWKQAVRGIDELLIEGTSYGSLIVAQE
ncbi:MAG: hypothetical protein L3K16_08275 [Thermoplasmata archaeon]|nr:hypothetical protein [Thermoplasmata archaeon]